MAAKPSNGGVFNDRRSGTSTGKVYAYDPVPHDKIMGLGGGLKPGDPVRLSKQSGIGHRPPGPMGTGYRYVEHADTGEFHGMVNRTSLVSPAQFGKKTLK